jgi:hypothetical protein
LCDHIYHSRHGRWRPCRLQRWQLVRSSLASCRVLMPVSPSPARKRLPHGSHFVSPSRHRARPCARRLAPPNKHTTRTRNARQRPRPGAIGGTLVDHETTPHRGFWSAGSVPRSSPSRRPRSRCIAPWIGWPNGSKPPSVNARPARRAAKLERRAKRRLEAAQRAESEVANGQQSGPPRTMCVEIRSGPNLYIFGRYSGSHNINNIGSKCHQGTPQKDSIVS